ncbi:MAG: Na+/H+ antiporter NhaC family protein, partial [Lachnospiraceae bacterium]|nr:Na+/H+ antiporter NhaC family protein [Lachnospiraceae bacterium]
MTKKRRTRITLAALLVISMCAMFGMTVFATDTQEDYSINLLGEEQETKEDDLTAGTTDANEETETEPIAGEETQETDLSDMDSALGYVDEYNTNVTEDESFETHLKTAVETIRSDVKVYGTIISLLPPIIAIVLALITKEVYFSLFTGIISGALLYCGFAPFDTIKLTFEVIISKLTDGWNVGILIFLVILGIIVSLTNKAGGSAAYADWASKKISSKRGASLATFLLGIMIFVDDYFNCLTVGSVMRPVTDRQKMSRAKLAYIIDATAAPVCIIAPISSWAAAVTSVAPEGQGLSLFVRAIPYNFYALLTIVMIIVISVLKFDYGPMKKHEMNADNGDLFTSGKMEETPQEKGKKAYVIDLILPVIVLIISCVAGMIQTGGFFDKSSDNFLNFVYSFSDADASVGLVFGSFIALAFTVIFYL